MSESISPDKAQAQAPADQTKATAPITFKRRGARSKGTFRKRAASPVKPATRDSSYDSSDDEVDALQGPRAKRIKKGTVAFSSTENKTTKEGTGATVFQANRDVPLTDTNDATKRKDWYDQPKGPARAAANVRITTTMDFAPDVCKDYKKTGWCGFGDACVFLHDRSDVQQGWQMDKEWEKVANGRKEMGGTVVASANRDKSALSKDDAEEIEMLEKIPFNCIICEEPYKAPIITRCGHYFCEPCALKRYRKDPTCKNCGAATAGVFNRASKLEKLLSRKREREAEKAAEAQEAEAGG